MSGTIGGQVKVTLTLDDAGFSMKIREAGTQVKSLGSNLSSLGRMSETVETKLGTLGKNVSMSSANLKTLTSSAAALDKQFGSMRQSMNSFNASAEMASQNAGLLNGVVLKLAALLDGAAQNTNRAAAANRNLATSQTELNRATTATVNGLTAQERAVRNLGTGHEALARKIVLAAGLARNEHAKAAAAEIDANNKTLQARQRSLDAALKAEREFRERLAQERSKEQAMQWRVDSRRDTSTGRILSASSPTLAGYQRELQLQQQKVQSMQLGLSILGQEADRLRGNMATIREQNNALGQRIGVEGRIEAALIRQKQRADEYLRTQREQAAQRRQDLEMTRQQMEMVKGMAAIYAGSKVWQGEKSSVRLAGEFERTGVRAQAMGLTAQERSEFDTMVKIDSARTPGLTQNDAATARIAAMGGLASTNQRQINQTLPQAIDAAQNIQYITGEEGHESFENFIRNLYGVAEARQVQYDKEKTKDTFELVQKIMAATGNKIDIPDLETFLRRIGTDGASQISDQGIINTVALLDQMKVSGGGGGGGAGGVSTVGTMFKMLQAYAGGKTMSNEMVSQVAAAGLLNTDALTSAGEAQDQSLKKVMAEAKKAGFKNGELFKTDPVQAVREMMAAVLGTISNEVNRKKYFGDSDVNDPAAQRVALSRWATRNGTTTTASNLLVTLADPRMQERIDHQSDMIGKSSTIEELKELRSKTYEQQVKNFDAAMTNLKMTLGTSILPMMTSFFEWLSKIADKMQSFASENPMVSQIVMIGGAVTGAVLALAGFAKTIGIIGGVTGVLRALGTEAAGSSGKVGILTRTLSVIGSVALAPIRLVSLAITGIATALSGNLLSSLAALAGRFTAVAVAGNTLRAGLAAMAAPFAAMAGRVLALGARFTGLGATLTTVARVVGAAFLRMIPYVGWLYAAWELSGLILQFEVGFASIGEWMDHWMAQTLNKAETFAINLRNKFRFTDESKVEGQERLAQIKAEGEAEQKAFDEMRQKREKDKADAKAKKEKDEADQKAKTEAENKALEDLIAGKGFEHHTPTAAINTNNTPFELPDAPAPRAARDQFVRSLADVTKNAEITAMKISAAIRGTSDSLYEQARVEFFEKWRAGDFDPNHDANLRPFKNATGGLDWNAANASGEGPGKWIETRERMLQQEEQLKALTYANERVAAAREDANTAMERGLETTVKETREMAGLQRELARTEERLRNGTKEFTAWNAKKNEALFERARSDAANFTADFAEGDRTTRTNMIYNSKERIGAQFDQQAQKDKETFDLRTKTMKTYYDEARKYIQQLDIAETEKAARLTALDQEFNEARTKTEREYTEHVQVQANAREYAQRGAIAKMQQDWENSFDKMDEVAANWGNQFVDSLSTWLTGGSVSWREFLAGMLKDVLAMNLKQAFAKPMSSALEGVSDLIVGAFKRTPTGGATQGAAGAVGSAASAGAGGLLSSAGSMLSGAGRAVQGGFSSLAGSLGFDKLAAATKVTTESVAGLATDGAAEATKGLIKNAAQLGISTSAETSAAFTLQGFTMAVSAATTALISMAASSAGSGIGGLLGSIGGLAATAYGGYSGAATATSGVTSGTGTGFGLGQTLPTGGSVFGFANGGIMSNMGPLPLKAYEKGGIADGPQIALFGEGRYKEAYVPLPDGRSIPVTFTGDSAGGSDTSRASGGATVYSPVTISIAVTTAADGTTGETESSNGAGADQWKGAATRIKAIVREVLVQESRPQGLLDKRK